MNKIKVMKYYTSQEIWGIFNKLSSKDKITILFDALDSMESYNGRSQVYCIALAMGYENSEGDLTHFYKEERNTE